MGAFAVAHVLFNWDRLVAYARFRLRRPETRPSAAGAIRRKTDAEPAHARGGLVGRVLLSRRGLFGLTVGAVGGLAIGRGLRPPPQLSVGSDVGLVYHEWSKPGLLDALGSVANWGQFPELYKTYPRARRVALVAAATWRPARRRPGRSPTDARPATTRRPR